MFESLRNCMHIGHMYYQTLPRRSLFQEVVFYPDCSFFTQLIYQVVGNILATSVL